MTLNCTGDDPERLQKRVQIIQNCSCSTCDAGDDFAAMSPLSASGDGEIGTDHKASLPDVGDLIDFMIKTQSKGPAAGTTGGTQYIFSVSVEKLSPCNLSSRNMQYTLHYLGADCPD